MFVPGALKRKGVFLPANKMAAACCGPEAEVGSAPLGRGAGRPGAEVV